MIRDTKLKVVLITGALSDIGRATAKAFAEAGYGLVINHRQKADQTQTFAEMLTQQHGAPQARAIQADVRYRDELSAMFEQSYQFFGKVDVLVNNAGVNLDRPFLEMSDEEWEMVIDTVLKGTFLCSQEFARRYTGFGGNIINIGAVTALKGRTNGANYCSARAGVLALTKCMALELAPRIRVNTVTPGWIDTDEVSKRYQLDDVQIKEKIEQGIPMKRLGTPDDVAGTILFLVSSGQYITGQNFLVDGGIYMR